jgi:hypothetical protein
MSVSALPTACAAAVVFAWTLSGLASPAAAGEVCNETGLSSPCISNSDLKASYVLGGSSGDGRLRVRDEAKDTAVDLRGTNGNVTNLFSNDEDEGNGLVKAWAAINSDGSVANCWRCDKDPSATFRVSTGVYQIDFTPLSTDITGRPRSVSVSGAGAIPVAAIRTADVDGDASALNVGTNNPTTGAAINAPFVLIIY